MTDKPDIIKNIETESINEGWNDTIKKWERKCPICNKVLFYVQYKNWWRANKHNCNCKGCALIKQKENPRRGPQKISTNTKWTRYCPNCKIVMFYSNHKNLWRANDTNRLCKKCVFSNPNFIQKMHSLFCGKNHPGYGKHRSAETKIKISKSLNGGHLSEECKKKMRLAMIKKIKGRIGQVHPGYNPIACKLIDDYGQKNGYKFRHAENGGEFFIEELGYWVDGYDKEKNIIIEYYELRHLKTKERDGKRKQEIINHLKCKFIEMWYDGKIEYASQI